ncbi:trigger factor [Paucidesulfovibrio longus]|uniref:trigger factor n=1 Tax=Paucidesulfovibrio longus TaxID=889 RepID=UPI0003B3A632|nr:trigger factor [Paucidesulfovibrio longus]
MEYEIKELSPVKREISIKVPAEEVNAALATTVALYKRGHEVHGFRKGKAPASVIEAKFRAQIYGEATTDLINYQINEIMAEMGVQPVSRIDVDAKELVRDEDFVYTISFEAAPEIDLPEYSSFEVEMDKVEVDEAEIAEVEKRILENAAEVKVVEDVRPGKDGEVVTVSFGAYDEDGKVVDGIKAESFDLTLGKGQALEEFEELLKTLEPGAMGEKEITFPEDFINTNIAGKKLTMKATVHAVKERIVPAMDDKVAKKAGFDSVETMRTAIVESYKSQRTQLAKSKAHKELLDKMLEGLDFELPPSMVADRIDRLVADLEQRLDRQGKSLSSTGKSLDELREEYRTQAEEGVRAELFLLAVARKEAFEVTPQEIDIAISQMAMQTRQPFHNLKQYYEEHGLVVPLRDRLLADKAMEFIFENAKVIEVDAPAVEEEGGEESEAKAPAKKAAAKKAPAKKAPAKKPAAKKPAAKKSADESGDKE